MTANSRDEVNSEPAMASLLNITQIGRIPYYSAKDVILLSQEVSLEHYISLSHN